METTFKPGDAVRVSRTGKNFHHYLGRVLEKPTLEGLVWVAFDKVSPTHNPPSEATYRRLDKATHKLLPTTQLQAI
jgi:hypothetical protein